MVLCLPCLDVGYCGRLLEPGLGAGHDDKPLIAGSLPMGFGRDHPKKATWEPILVGSPSAGGAKGVRCQGFWVAFKMFWITTWHLRKGKQCTVDTVYSGDDVLLTSTKDVDRCREYFEDLLNPTDMSSSGQEGPGDLGMGSLMPGLKLLRWSKNSSVAGPWG